MKHTRSTVPTVRAQAEQALRRTLEFAPKFYCTHCQRPGKTLNHISRCKRGGR